mmetsp:Transcript_8283/g.18513  ORF Transcript_8283/g.18513 Transcript_8283/m.18513 type:complete len:215 (-) Transcript_8283:48-692(-)
MMLVINTCNVLLRSTWHLMPMRHTLYSTVCTDAAHTTTVPGRHSAPCSRSKPATVLCPALSANSNALLPRRLLRFTLALASSKVLTASSCPRCAAIMSAVAWPGDLVSTATPSDKHWRMPLTLPWLAWTSSCSGCVVACRHTEDPADQVASACEPGQSGRNDLGSVAQVNMSACSESGAAQILAAVRASGAKKLCDTRCMACGYSSQPIRALPM